MLGLSPPSRESRRPPSQQVIAGHPGGDGLHITGAQETRLLSFSGCSRAIGCGRKHAVGPTAPTSSAPWSLSRLGPMWALVAATVSLPGSVCQFRVPMGSPPGGWHQPASRQCSGSRGLAPCARRGMCSQPRECQGHQKLRGARVSSLLGPPRECGSVHLSLTSGLLTEMRGNTCVVLSPHICANLSRQP